MTDKFAILQYCRPQEFSIMLPAKLLGLRSAVGLHCKCKWCAVQIG